MLDVFFYVAQSSSEKQQQSKTQQLKRPNHTTLQDEETNEEEAEDFEIKNLKKFKEKGLEKVTDPLRKITYRKEETSLFNGNQDLLEKFELLSNQNKELTTIVTQQQDIIHSIAKLVIDGQKDTETRITKMHGEITQLGNVLNGYIRSEINTTNKKKVQSKIISFNLLKLFRV